MAAFRAFDLKFRWHLESIVRFPRAAFEKLMCLFPVLILEALIVNAGIDRIPGKATGLKGPFAIANTVSKIVSRVEHECMPDHKHV